MRISDWSSDVCSSDLAGYLAALVPEEYGGSGLPLAAGCAILEEVQKAGCNGAACHAQMYTMGTLLRHGSEAQKQRYLPGIAEGKLRLQAFGVTEPTSRSEEHTSELQSLMRSSYAVFCLKKKNKN